MRLKCENCGCEIVTPERTVNKLVEATSEHIEMHRLEDPPPEHIDFEMMGTDYVIGVDL